MSLPDWDAPYGVQVYCSGPATEKAKGWGMSLNVDGEEAWIWQRGVKMTRRQVRQLKRDIRNGTWFGFDRHMPPASPFGAQRMSGARQADKRRSDLGFLSATGGHPKAKSPAVNRNSIPQLIAAGYCRISNSHLMIGRIDRPDWREYMAKEHSPWDPSGEGMQWASSDRMGDHYRRCYSKDKIVLPPDMSDIYRMFPGSGEGPDHFTPR